MSGSQQAALLEQAQASLPGPAADDDDEVPADLLVCAHKLLT